MDESTPTCNKRFARLGIPRPRNTRRAYREMLVTTPGSEQVHQRGDPVRRDDPPAADDDAGALHPGPRRWPEIIPASRSIPVPKAWPVIRAEGDRGAGRIARAPRRVLRDGRPVRQVARGHRDRRRHTQPGLHRARTRMRWRVTPRCARRPASCPSSSRKCSWTATTP